jgi:hypothetical protein
LTKDLALILHSPKLSPYTLNWLGKTRLPEPVQGDLRCH